MPRPSSVFDNSAPLASASSSTSSRPPDQTTPRPAMKIGHFAFASFAATSATWSGFGGIGAVTLARGGGDGQGGGSLAGNALVLLAVCGEAAYALLSKRLAGRMPLLAAGLWMQIFSALLLLPAWLPLAIPWPGAAGVLADPLLAGLLIFHGLTASVFSLLLWYSGLRRAPAGLAGVFMAFLPASAAVTAVLFLGEPMTTAHLAGFALMLASLLLATWPARRG